MAWENPLGILEDEDSEPTLKDVLSQQTWLSDEECWADKMKPSRRRRNPMTRLQRRLSAHSLRELRRERRAAELEPSGSE